MAVVGFIIALFLVVVKVTTTSALELEAEDGSGYPTGAQRPRSAASNDATVALNQGQSITLHFSVFSSCTVSVSDVAYTNDGGADTISVRIDETSVGSFQTVAESNAGHNWNVVRNSGSLGSSVSIISGLHTVRVTATSTDQYGVEIDKVSLVFNSECIQRIQCIDPPSTLPSYAGTCDNITNEQGSVLQRSVVTDCAEEDNVHVPIYFNNIGEFTLTATLPGYASLTRANNRNANFTNCELTSRTVWMLGSDDMTSTEFASSCASLPSSFHVDNQTTHMCGALNNQNRRELTLTFIANGPSSGEVESSIGSLLTVQFAQITGTLVVEAAAYGRANTWLSLGRNTFTSTRSRSFTWQVPDLTWMEGNNMIRLIVIPADSSLNADGTFDYIKLEKRQETGEFEIAEVYNDGITIVKAIGKDFWWLHPQAMVLRNTRTGLQWSNVVYLRVLRKIPSINSWPEVFVLYQDGNSRILTFPPSGIDWIPFGSSVIIGASDPDSVRPYAAISRIDFDPRTLKFTLYFSAGGQAVLSIATNTTTVVTVSNITYAMNASRPFATFRSMWVSNGNSDVDHVRSDANTRAWHIMQDRWTSLTGKNFLFFRTCVSQHNTLSPDIRIQVQCSRVAEDSTTTDSGTSRLTTLIAMETTSAITMATSAQSTSKGPPVSSRASTVESDTQDRAPSAAEDTKTNKLLIVFIINFVSFFANYCC